MSLLAHGGALDAAIATHGGLRKHWLDLSTGINPTSWPVPDLPQALWHRLPDANDLDGARRSARTAYAAPDDAGIVVAPGTQAIIQWLPFLLPRQPVAILGSTYGEHAASYARAGHEVLVTDGIASAEASARVVVIVNPDNPTGRVREPAALHALARRLAARGGWLIVDEAFCDVAPTASVVDRTGRDGLVVLRSLGKFYGLAGARVGFALTSPGMAAKLEDALGPWAVGAPALHVAALALADRVWTKRMQRILGIRRAELEAVLGEAGCTIEGATDLFVTVRHPEASEVAARLLDAMILVRTFPSASDRLRFGVPGGQRALARLATALT